MRDRAPDGISAYRIDRSDRIDDALQNRLRTSVSSRTMHERSATWRVAFAGDKSAQGRFSRTLSQKVGPPTGVTGSASTDAILQTEVLGTTMVSRGEIYAIGAVAGGAVIEAVALTPEQLKPYEI
jgi:hypothetical protein